MEWVLEATHTDTRKIHTEHSVVGDRSGYIICGTQKENEGPCLKIVKNFRMLTTEHLTKWREKFEYGTLCDCIGHMLKKPAGVSGGRHISNEVRGPEGEIACDRNI